MKSIFLAVLTSLGLATQAFAADCSASHYSRCKKQPSCSSFYICQVNELSKLNAEIAKMLSEANLEELESCQQMRSEIELDILGHQTTIECTDSEDGPEFGG